LPAWSASWQRIRPGRPKPELAGELFVFPPPRAKSSLRIVVNVACFWLGILLVLTPGDNFRRGMVPFAPGH
jgi:hypothetical protein